MNERVGGWWKANPALVQGHGYDGSFFFSNEIRYYGYGRMTVVPRRALRWSKGFESNAPTTRPALEQGLGKQRAHVYWTRISAHQARKANPVMSFTVSQRQLPLRSW